MPMVPGSVRQLLHGSFGGKPEVIASTPGLVKLIGGTPYPLLEEDTSDLFPPHPIRLNRQPSSSDAR